MKTPNPSYPSVVLRGGALYGSARLVRCATRFKHGPDYALDHAGFRVVLSAKEKRIETQNS